MIVLQITGFITLGFFAIFLLNKLYRKIFGYSWSSCPNNHDTMARYGSKKCNKCLSKL